MPWKVLKRSCKKSDGKTGTYVIVKIKRGGRTEQSSCHTSKKKAQGGVRARHANEGKMKITRTQLRSIIKEVLENIQENSDPSATEFELYSDLSGITKQLDEFSSKLNVAMGLTATATKQSQLSDEVYETIRSAIFGLNDARIKMARAIGQDPAPDLAPVRER